MTVYHRVMDAPFITTPIVVGIMLNLFAFKEFNSQEKRKNIYYQVISLLILLIIPLIVFYAKPKYTYNEARNIICKAEYKNKEIKFVDTPMNAMLENSPNIFIDKVYTIEIEENKTTLEYVFNPITGAYGKIEDGTDENAK